MATLLPLVAWPLPLTWSLSPAPPDDPLGPVGQDPDVVRAEACRLVSSDPSVCSVPKPPKPPDVDGNSAVYQASWKGPATFKWEGPEVGYIVRVTPKGYTPDPLPDFEKMSDTELVTALESPSHIRTLTAQRTLLRREPKRLLKNQNPVKNVLLWNPNSLRSPNDTKKDPSLATGILGAASFHQGRAWIGLLRPACCGSR